MCSILGQHFYEKNSSIGFNSLVLLGSPDSIKMLSTGVAQQSQKLYQSKSSRISSTLLLTSFFPEDLRKLKHFSWSGSSRGLSQSLSSSFCWQITGTRAACSHPCSSITSGLTNKKSSVTSRWAGVTKHLWELRYQQKSNQPNMPPKLTTMTHWISHRGRKTLQEKISYFRNWSP